jgi:hypothetical protein
MEGGTVFQMDQATPADKAVLRHQPQCRQDADIDRRERLRPRGRRQKTTAPQRDLYTLLQILSLSLFEKMPVLQVFSQAEHKTEIYPDHIQMSLLDL